MNLSTSYLRSISTKQTKPTTKGQNSMCSKHMKTLHHALFFLDLRITNPINMHKKQRSTTPANTGINMAYSWGRKYWWMKWSLSTNGWTTHNMRIYKNQSYAKFIKSQKDIFKNVLDTDQNDDPKCVVGEYW